METTFNTSNMPGRGDRETFPSGTVDPQDFDADAHEAEVSTQAEKIRKQLSAATKIQNRQDMSYQEHFAEKTQIEVADNLIRYLADVDVCNLINGVLAKNKDMVFSSVEQLINESIQAVAKNRIESQQ